MKDATAHLTNIHKIEQTTIDYENKTKEEEKSILVESKIDDGKLLIDWWHLFGRVLLLKLINNLNVLFVIKIYIINQFDIFTFFIFKLFFFSLKITSFV